MTVKAKPDGYHSVTPYLIVRNARDAIEFYNKAFAAETLMVMDMPGGGVAHAEIKIGDSPVMLADEMPAMGCVGPETLGGSGVGVMLYVDDVDAMFANAIACGGTEVQPVTDQFYGDRSGTLKDPFGHKWTISTHKEDLTEQQLNERMAEFFAQMAKS
jgi:PhnB protein